MTQKTTVPETTTTKQLTEPEIHEEPAVCEQCKHAHGSHKQAEKSEQKQATKTVKTMSTPAWARSLK